MADQVGLGLGKPAVESVLGEFNTLTLLPIEVTARLAVLVVASLAFPHRLARKLGLGSNPAWFAERPI